MISKDKIKTFKELGLKEDIMKSLDDLGFEKPTPIQAETIPFILNSKNDLVALAQTGTGKTAGFSLPILNQISTNKRSLDAFILCPTRELAIQISRDIESYTKHTKGISVTAVYGGTRIDLQIRTLRRGVNIVVGTPGRVHDLIRRNVLKLNSVKWLVLDEADEMLDMGFKDDLDAILEQTPDTRQTLLFSATMSRGVSNIAKNYMKKAKEISVGSRNTGAENVTHEYYVVQARDRFETLKRILDCIPDVYGILFCRTRRETQDVADKLRQAKYQAEAIHGDVSQSNRTKIMDRFKNKHIKLLVATDVAARGIDVKDLTHIINYNLPDQNTSYTHRSGRTGRADKSGIAISIVGPRDIRKIKELEKALNKPFEYKQVPSGKDIHERQIDNFIDSIKVSDSEKIDAKFLEDITHKLKGVKKEDLIKHFVSKELSHLFNDNQGTRDLNSTFKANAEKSRTLNNATYLKINLGRKHRFNIKTLFAMINSSNKLRGMHIGQIDLHPEYSTFAVEKKYVSEVINSLNKNKFSKMPVEVSVSNDQITEATDNFSRKRNRRKNKSPRRNKGNRGDYRRRR